MTTVEEISQQNGKLFELCLTRPSNYFMLDTDQQRSIDQRLGISDWLGECSHKNDINKCNGCKQRFSDHFKISDS